MENQPEKFELDVINEDAVVDVKIGYAFYMQMKALVMNLAKNFTPEQFQTMSQKIQKKESITDEKELEIALITALLVDIENNAKAQSKTSKKTFSAKDFAN